ncbi:MAG TPA: CAP domain-containing protein [Leptospiraceae bacterium]|nr:CAP domain-containing protein [Leptospiraceae bacterium]HMZ58826.1 CAP domain-containing protein [Leptospiraceae bacterium]HNI26271.1 CAP domain-containing protein [Leptospiraceae bacterium]HNI97234.1 CAP domain-containing protein [Leptospiraceae bacterium]HNM03233.1 CAP domain-containing protein [Leptospiraceae bacterium]
MKFIIFLFIGLKSVFSVTEREIGKRPDLDFKKVSAYIIYYTNLERTGNGLSFLRYDPVLNKASEIHSTYMAKNRIMSHSENELRDPSDRVRAACGSDVEKCMKKFEQSISMPGSYHVCCGENVITSLTSNSAGISYFIRTDSQGTYKEWKNADIRWYDESGLAKDMVSRWMKSPGHRANILNPEYNSMGAAADFNAETEYYYGTQVFSPYADGAFDYDPFSVSLEQKENHNPGIRIDPGKKLSNTSVRIYLGEKLQETEKQGQTYLLSLPKDIQKEKIISIEVKDRARDYWYPYWQIRIFSKDEKMQWEWKRWEY